MNYEFENNIPIYMQIIDIIRTQIVSGKLNTNEKIPTVRQLAITMQVNPNTIVKALSILEEEKLIYTKRTLGKYVTDDKELIAKVKKELATKKVKTFIDSMNDIGIDYNTSIKYLQEMKGR